LDEGDDLDDDSSNWIKAINRGGLTKVNNDTYQLFVAMEVELCKQFASKEVPVLSQDTKKLYFKMIMFSSFGALFAVSGRKRLVIFC